MMGVFYPLLWLTSQKAGVSDRGCRVHVVSDSEYVVRGITSEDPVHARATMANRMLWIAIHSCKRQGIILKAHHVKRDTFDLNRLCHDLANKTRRSQIKLLKDFEWDPVVSNPD